MGTSKNSIKARGRGRNARKSGVYTQYMSILSVFPTSPLRFQRIFRGTHMARTGNVNHPLYPVWPIRPVDKVEPKKHSPDRPPEYSRKDQPPPDQSGGDDDERLHIDDYA